MLAALGAIAALGVWGLEVGYAADSLAKTNAVIIEHLAEDVGEIKDDVNRLVRNQIAICTSLGANCT